MKNISYLFILLSFISCRDNSNSVESSLQEDNNTTTSKDQEDQREPHKEITNVEDIKKEYSYILSMTKSGSMDSTFFNYNCNGEKEGKVIFFYEDEQLRLIRHTYNEYSHFSATDEYFIKAGELFFVFYDQLAWNFAGQNQTEDNITERRFYILNNQPVECLEKKYTVISNDENSPESDKVANKKIECTSFEEVIGDFELLIGLKEQEGDLECLEK